MKNNPYILLLKPVVTIASLSIAGLVAYNFLKNYKVKKKQKEEGKEFSAEQKQKLSYPKTQYKAWADSLNAAWYEYPFGLGTIEETVYDIIRKMKNNSDWLELQKAYGIRPYYSGGFHTDDLNLVESIIIEDEQGQMRNKINSIFKSKGIKYRL